MSKNPKVIAGIIGAAVLAVLCAVVIARMVPTIGKVQVEMSLTPTPLPAVPASVRAVPGQPGQPTAVPPLHNGSQGERVRQLQERLQELGFYAGEVDGQFGPGTKEAVVAFQAANGLDTDGMAGEETMNLLNSGNAKRAE